MEQEIAFMLIYNYMALYASSKIIYIDYRSIPLEHTDTLILCQYLITPYMQIKN